MKITTAFVFAFAVSIGGVSLAYAQDAPPVTHTYHHHHRAHHRLPAVRDAAPVLAPAAAATTSAPQAAPFGLAWPRIAPYPDNKGDEDGLS
jgi:hypothetical protein